MRAIFLDRDGVICENRADHVKSWSEFKFLPGAKSGLVTLSRLGLPIIIATNQAVIGRGIVSASVVEEIHQRMVDEITAFGGRIDRVLYCPHCPEDKCDCRKPKPGMLLRAATEMDLDLSQSYLIGDAASDVQAGQQVGCHTCLVLTGQGVEQLIPALHFAAGYFFAVARNLMEAANYIVKAEMIAKDEPDPSQLTFMGRYRQLLAAVSF
jgi:D-glycero-D-manno-heptose 1,7-bisphosphate phosphatase